MQHTSPQLNKKIPKPSIYCFTSLENGQEKFASPPHLYKKNDIKGEAEDKKRHHQSLSGSLWQAKKYIAPTPSRYSSRERALARNFAVSLSVARREKSEPRPAAEGGAGTLGRCTPRGASLPMHPVREHRHQAWPPPSQSSRKQPAECERGGVYRSRGNGTHSLAHSVGPSTCYVTRTPIACMTPVTSRAGTLPTKITRVSRVGYPPDRPPPWSFG
jgi:hypothetical protein